MTINPEILSQEPTHTYHGKKVKVFGSTANGFNHKGQKVATAEIMSGKYEGTWTTVVIDELEPIK